MFAAGLVEETRGLLARYGPVKALDSLGYRQARGVLDGAMSVEDAIAAAQQGHRNYAKRQMTWFRREPEVHWIEGFGDEAETVRVARSWLRARWRRLTDREGHTSDHGAAPNLNLRCRRWKIEIRAIPPADRAE